MGVAPLTDYSIVRDFWDRPFVTTDGGPLQYEKGRKTPINAEPYTRISTLAGMLDNGGGLLDYYAARAMLGVAKNEALYARVCHLASAHHDAWKAPEGKKPLKELVKKALSAGGADDAADRGTAFHGVCEIRDGGGEAPYVPRAMWPWIEARDEALEEYEPVLIEPFVVNDELKAAGSPDRYLRHKETGIVYAADDKTGDDEPDYPFKVTVQVAIASKAVLYDQATGKRTPIECDRERGLLIHTPVNTRVPQSTLYWLELPQGYETAQRAAVHRDKRNFPKLKKVRSNQ